MNTIRKDVRDLITVNEKIQSALAQGDRLTDDESIIIRMCAGELLEKVPDPRPETWYSDDDGNADRGQIEFPEQSFGN